LPRPATGTGSVVAEEQQRERFREAVEHKKVTADK
jgi:hypothetical protein